MAKKATSKQLNQQRSRLVRAKARLEAAEASGDKVEIRKARDSVRAHTKHIAALERKQGQARLARASNGKVQREAGEDFYRSQAWRALRYRVLAKSTRRCECCGASPETGAVLHVDHIKPRSTHPHLELDPSNMQILCEACNLGKSNADDTDFRR